jgi:Mce-associated membrane protein
MSQLSQQPAVSRRKIAGERIGRSEANKIRPPGIDGLLPPPRMADLVGGFARRRATVPGWLLIGLAALTAAVLVFDTVSWARSGAASGSTALAPNALSAVPAQAEKAAEQILSYDYADLEQDTAVAAGYMTPAYAQTFQRTVDDLLTRSATAQRGVVAARVMASGVVSAEPGKVTVLLFVDQTATTKSAKTPQTALNRVLFTMVDQGGRWLVDDVTAL